MRASSIGDRFDLSTGFFRQDFGFTGSWLDRNIRWLVSPVSLLVGILGNQTNDIS